MIFAVIHFLFGSVSFTADGGFAERFINLCTSMEIRLWAIHRTTHGLTAYTSIDGYKKIKKAARQSGMKVRLKKKSGLPFICQRYESHMGLFVGLVAVLLVLTVMSNHIWVINVHGNETVESEKIEEIFANAGLKIGVRKNKLDASSINSEAVLNIGELSWASINIDGSVAEIEVREALKRPNVEKNYGTSNLVARKDGQVEIIEPYKGSAAIKTGQTVTQGGLLVSGVRQSKNGMSTFTDSDGYIVARTKIVVEVHKKKEIVVLRPKTKKIYSIYILGREFLPAKKQTAAEIYRHKSWLYIDSVKMPFGIFYTMYTDYEETKTTADEMFSELLAMNDYALESYHQTLHSQIISQEVTMKDGKINGEYSCFENIGEKVRFETEEIPNLIDTNDAAK